MNTATVLAEPKTTSPDTPQTRRRIVVAVACWATLIVGAAAWGAAMNAAGRPLFLGAPPLFVHADFSVGVAIIAALVIASVAITTGPRIAARLSWRRLLWATFAIAALWATALVFARAGASLTRPLEAPQDFLHDLPLVAGPGDLLRTFVGDIDSYATHVRAHPPGMLLVLWTFARIGLGGSGAAAALVIAAGASAASAAMIAARAVAGEDVARRAAPFLALSPAAIWIATSSDALSLGIGTWAVALAVVAITKRTRADAAIAAAGGALFGATLMLSYGLLLLGVVPVTVAAALRRWRALAIVAGTAAAVLASFALAGFSWPSGLAATRREYLASGAFARPYSYFLIGNLAALAIVLGPAAAAGLARVHGRILILVSAGIGAVLLADISGMSKGEVERIWLPFVPWVLVAAATIGRRGARFWLAAQAATALAVTVALRTPW